jgi:hypothetical protein
VAYGLLFFISFSSFLLEMLLIRTIFAVFPGGLTAPVVAFSSFGFSLGAVGFYFVRREWRWMWTHFASLALAVMAVFYLVIFAVLGSPFLLTNSWSFAILFPAIAAFFSGPGFFAAFIFSKDQRQAPKAYASDLFGGCLGAVLSLVLLEHLGRGPTLILILVLMLSAMTFSAKRIGSPPAIAAWIFSFLLILLGPSVLNRPLMCDPEQGEPFTGQHSSSLVELNWKKGPLDIVLRSDRVKILEENRRKIHGAYLARLDCRGRTMTVDYDDKSALKHLEQEIHSLPFRLRTYDRAAFFGTGLGMDLVRADYFGVVHPRAFEINPYLIELEKKFLGSRSHYLRGNVDLVIGDSRRQVTIRPDIYDLIYISSSKNYGRVGVSPSALLLNRQLTMEALETYWDKLNADGVFYAVDDEKHVLDISANLRALLNRHGVNEPGHAVLVFDGAGYAGYLLSKSRLSRVQLASLAAKARENGWRIEFDLLGAGRGIVTDDQPSLRTRFVKEYRSGEMSWFKSLVLIALALVPAILLAPWARGQQGASLVSANLFHFLLIGVTFTSTQVAFLYGLEILFETPTITVAMTLVLMLTAASLGAMSSTKLARRFAFLIPAAIALLLAALFMKSDFLVHYFYSKNEGWRFMTAALTVVPVSYLMGFIFPFHMNQLPPFANGWIPALIGTNGLGTLIGAIAATVIISEAGISAIYLVNAVLMAVLALSMFAALRLKSGRI